MQGGGVGIFCKQTWKQSLRKASDFHLSYYNHYVKKQQQKTTKTQKKENTTHKPFKHSLLVCVGTY